MNPSPQRHRWRRVERLFDALLDRPPEERKAHLIESCRDDLSLIEEVRSLLDSDDAAGEFLNRSPLDDCRPRPPILEGETVPTLLGRRIGPYRLEEVIASGGMATVYLGLREEDGTPERVAVKMIQPGLGTDAIVARFEIERQALAGLDHPNIARLLGGGRTPDGHPYIVLEYVEGESIDTYCEARGLTVRQRVELFRAVCAAVQYAHGELLVHRDIKPANVLVTDDGVVKLLDFGIAKLLDPGVGDVSLTTPTQRFLSPEYASPEQVLGQSIGTASDVYSLGVTLYQLLTGRRPFSMTGKTAAEIERIVCEQDVTRPSRAVAQTGGTTGSAAGPRGVKRLSRRLAGDLDNIVMTALRKQPALRYASVEQFSEDLRRHLEGLPITARRPTLRYRATKFVRRNRVAVGAGALVFLSLTAGTIATALEARRARTEARTARNMLLYVDRLLADLDPRLGDGDVTVRNILDRNGERVMEELAGQPEPQAMLAERIAGVYEGLGFPEPGLEWRQRALALYTGLYGENHRKVADSLHALGIAMRVHDLELAEQYLRRALELRRRLLGDDHPDVAATMFALAGVLFRRGDYETPQSLFEGALEIHRRGRPRPDPELVNMLAGFANYLQDLGRYDRALALAREAFSIAGRLGPSYDARSVHWTLAGVLQDLGRYDEAEPVSRRALEIVQARYGEDHWLTQVARLNLALLLKDMGRLEEADALCRSALRIVESLWGDAERYPVGDAWLVQAKILAAQREWIDAAVAARKAAALSRNDSERARRNTLLARVLVELGRHDEAAVLAREAHQILLASRPSGSWQTAKAACVLGAALTELGEFDGAERHLLASYPIIRRDRGEHHPWTAFARDRLVALYEAWGKPEQAMAFRAPSPGMLREVASDAR